ncbi:MAG: hypothetical protein HC811_00590 [Flammeovirgaceae bacterium]|nr:hypothetical protein [Flammeovirgaceae bacterium]
MKKILIIVAAVSMAFTVNKMIKTKVADGITVTLPDTLAPMQPEDILQRFPSVRNPLGAYTNIDRDVDFSVNISATQWPDGDINLAQKFFKTGINNLYDQIEMIDEGIHEINKRQYIYFIFESRQNADQRSLGVTESKRKYTYIQYLVEPRRTLVFTFSCPIRTRDDWEEMAHTIMNSLRVK